MKKVLIIEDNKSQQFYLEHFIVKYFDCTTITADNGAEGMYLIQQEHPDLIILDLMMPVMDGIKMLETLRDNKRDFSPVIIMTAMNEKKIIYQLLTLGISDYIAKPLSVFNLYTKLEKYLDSKLLLA